MKQIARLFLILSCLSLAACVTPKRVPLNPTEGRLLAGKTLTTARHPKPDFTAMTAMRSMTGTMGALYMVADGNDRVRKDQVEDPANVIAQELARSIAQKYNARVLHLPEKETKSRTVSELARIYSEADYVLDVQTGIWAFSHYPTAWSRYRVLYNARLRLIDTRRRKVVSEGFFSSIPDDRKNAPTFDDLTRNNSAGLKAELAAAAANAIRHFKETLAL